MRLIKVHSMQFEQFHARVPCYAIPPHTWGDAEVTFEDMHQPHAAEMAGYAKIVYLCDQARADGLDYVWIDTCCIQKSSSSELSEAINSMFKWY